MDSLVHSADTHSCISLLYNQNMEGSSLVEKRDKPPMHQQVVTPEATKATALVEAPEALKLDNIKALRSVRVDETKQIPPHFVILGRGGATALHPGNIQFRRMIQINRFAYKKLKKHAKIQMAAAIYKHILDAGAQFISFVKGGNAWEVVCESIAIRKCSQGLRERKLEADKHESNVAYYEKDLPIRCKHIGEEIHAKVRLFDWFPGDQRHFPPPQDPPSSSSESEAESSEDESDFDDEPLDTPSKLDGAFVPIASRQNENTTESAQNMLNGKPSGRLRGTRAEKRRWLKETHFPNKAPRRSSSTSASPGFTDDEERAPTKNSSDNATEINLPPRVTPIARKKPLAPEAPFSWWAPSYPAMPVDAAPHDFSELYALHAKRPAVEH